MKQPASTTHALLYLHLYDQEQFIFQSWMQQTGSKSRVMTHAWLIKKCFHTCVSGARACHGGYPGNLAPLLWSCVVTHSLWLWKENVSDLLLSQTKKKDGKIQSWAAQSYGFPDTLSVSSLQVVTDQLLRVNVYSAVIWHCWFPYLIFTQLVVRAYFPFSTHSYMWFRCTLFFSFWSSPQSV